jgi:hypothetical protein
VLNRRRFLRGAAGATLALPFLPSLVSSTAKAGPATPPQRVVFVYAAQQESERFLPATSGPLSSLAGTYLEPLAAYRDRMTLVHNMSGAGGHSAGHSESFTGFPWGWDNGDMADHWTPKGGPSIDQYIASRVGTETPLRTLGLSISDLGLGRDDHETSWRRLPRSGEEGLAVLPSAPGSVVSVPHVRSPSEGYSIVFGSGGEPTVDRTQLLRRSLIDSVIDDTARVHSRLALADQRVLDSHLSQLRDYERRLGSAVPFTCEAGFGRPAAGDLDRQTSAPLHFDSIVGAFRCDATRVATFSFAASQDEHAYRWIGDNITNFHQISHENGDYTSDPSGDHARVRRWQTSELAYFLDQLAAVPEGDGTLLDHTLVVWLCELGLWTFGVEGNNHSRGNTPAMLIGNAGGALRQGHIVDAAGDSYHRFLLTLLHAIGYRDVASWGEEGTSPISSLLT